MADERFPGPSRKDYADALTHGVSLGTAVTRWFLLVVFTVGPAVLTYVGVLGPWTCGAVVLAGFALWHAWATRIAAERLWRDLTAAKSSLASERGMTSARAVILQRMAMLQSCAERISAAQMAWRERRKTVVSRESDQDCWDAVRDVIAEAREVVRGTEYAPLMGLRPIPAEPTYEEGQEAERGVRRDIEGVVRRLDETLPPRHAL